MEHGDDLLSGEERAVAAAVEAFQWHIQDAAPDAYVELLFVDPEGGELELVLRRGAEPTDTQVQELADRFGLRALDLRVTVRRIEHSRDELLAAHREVDAALLADRVPFSSSGPDWAAGAIQVRIH